MFSEAFLHFVWRMKLLDMSNLHTTIGEKVEILKLGMLNSNQGPDFLDAKIRIGNEILVGNIEMHIQNEDWYKHGHTSDPNYSNVILHVVFEPTLEAYTLSPSGNPIPILCLQNAIMPEIIKEGIQLMKSNYPIPCTNISVDWNVKPHIESFKERIVIDRLERKSKWIYNQLIFNDKNLETTFYQTIFAGFGLKVNFDFFLDIAIRTPQKVLAKYIQDQEKLEAILFGQAGLILPSDHYGQHLLKEYLYFQKLHQLQPTKLRPSYARLYPHSFPTLRLAQFAAFILNKSGLYSKLIDNQTTTIEYNLFSSPTSKYWHKHYNFGQEWEKSQKSISKEFIEKLYINSIIPFIYLKDRMEQKPPYRALEFLRNLKPENNKPIRAFRNVRPLENQNAFDSQSILEWYNRYCLNKNCTNCPIGVKILKRDF